MTSKNAFHLKNLLTIFCHCESYRRTCIFGQDRFQLYHWFGVDEKRLAIVILEASCETDW